MVMHAMAWYAYIAQLYICPLLSTFRSEKIILINVVWWLCYFWTRKIQVQIFPQLWSPPGDFGSVTTSQSNLNLQIHWGSGIGSEMAIYFSHHNDPNWFYRWMLCLFLCKLLIELKPFEQGVIAPWLFLSLLPMPLSSQSDAIWSISLWCGESRAGTEYCNALKPLCCHLNRL